MESKLITSLMNTQWIFRKVVLALFIWINATPVLAQPAPREILRRAEDNMRGTTSYTEMTMQTVRPRFTREITMRTWNLGDDYALVLITAPARDQGTAFLKRGREMWNFVPRIDRTVKMPPSMMSQSWMGSDFSNDDLMQGTSTVDDFTHRLLRSETINGHECYVLELIPKPEAPIVYSKVIYWVSKEYYLPVKVENYDEFGQIASTINFREFRQMGDRMLPAVFEMIPAGRPGHKTILTTHKADFRISLTPDFFTLQNLSNIR